jgi:hypothetical protein
MLSDFRFVFGAIMATTVLGVATFGVVVSLRLAREAHVAPIEGSRPLAYTKPGDWNHFYDAAGVKFGVGLMRGSEGGTTVPSAAVERPGPPLVILPEAIDPAPVPTPDTRTAARAPELEGAAVPAPVQSRDSPGDPTTIAPPANPSAPVAQLPILGEGNSATRPAQPTSSPSSVATPAPAANMVGPIAPTSAPAAGNSAPPVVAERGAMVTAEARLTDNDRVRATGPATRAESGGSAVEPRPGPMAAVTGEAAAVKPQDVTTQGPDAPLVESTIARAPANEAGMSEPANEPTGTIRQQPNAAEPTPTIGDRVANVSPLPEDPTAAPGQDLQPPAATGAPRARKAAARSRHVAKPKVAKIQETKAPNTRVRITRARSVTTPAVVEAPHA